MSKFMWILMVLFLKDIQGQNVGIGLANPAEKLDVNGNISTNGKIKLNGDFGSPGEVMMIDQAGNPSWSSNCQYKNFTIISTPGAVNFPVPNGATEVVIEQMSSGGGGAKGGGGGSGNLYRYLFNLEFITSFDIFNGQGGAPAVNDISAGSNGDSSFVKVNFGGSFLTFYNQGGLGAKNNEAGRARPFANYAPNVVIDGFEAIQGEGGKQNSYVFAQYNTNSFGQFFSGGMGGNPPGKTGGGGSGAVYGKDINSGLLVLTESRMPTDGSFGGGGGGGLGVGEYGKAGGGGYTIIRWN